MKIKYTEDNILIIGLSTIIIVLTIGVFALIYQQSIEKQDYDNLKISIENKQAQIDILNRKVNSLFGCVNTLTKILECYVVKGDDKPQTKNVKVTTCMSPIDSSFYVPKEPHIYYYSETHAAILKAACEKVGRDYEYPYTYHVPESYPYTSYYLERYPDAKLVKMDSE